MIMSLPNKIGGDNFRSVVISGNRSLVNKVLKEAGLSRFLTKKEISHREALKILRVLKDREKDIGKPIIRGASRWKSPSQIWQVAVTKQLKEKEELEEQKSRHIRAAVAEEVLQDLREEEKTGEEPMAKYYHPASALGKKRLVDEIEEERQQRERKVSEEQDKRKRLLKSREARQKPKLYDSQLPDMSKIKDIGTNWD